VWLKATARGRVRKGDVLPPTRSAKLKLPPFYKVNGKLKRGPLQHYRFSAKELLCLGLYLPLMEHIFSTKSIANPLSLSSVIEDNVQIMLYQQVT
jgi:hypothetical protein